MVELEKKWARNHEMWRDEVLEALTIISEHIELRANSAEGNKELFYTKYLPRTVGRMILLLYSVMTECIVHQSDVKCLIVDRPGCASGEASYYAEAGQVEGTLAHKGGGGWRSTAFSKAIAKPCLVRLAESCAVIAMEELGETDVKKIVDIVIAMDVIGEADVKKLLPIRTKDILRSREQALSAVRIFHNNGFLTSLDLFRLDQFCLACLWT